MALDGRTSDKTRRDG